MFTSDLTCSRQIGFAISLGSLNQDNIAFLAHKLQMLIPIFSIKENHSNNQLAGSHGRFKD